MRDPFAISFEVILKSQIEIWDGPPTMLGGPTSFTGKARKISYGGTTIFFLENCSLSNLQYQNRIYLSKNNVKRILSFSNLYANTAHFVVISHHCHSYKKFHQEIRLKLTFGVALKSCCLIFLSAVTSCLKFRHRHPSEHTHQSKNVICKLGILLCHSEQWQHHQH